MSRPLNPTPTGLPQVLRSSEWMFTPADTLKLEVYNRPSNWTGPPKIIAMSKSGDTTRLHFRHPGYHQGPMHRDDDGRFVLGEASAGPPPRVSLKPGPGKASASHTATGVSSPVDNTVPATGVSSPVDRIDSATGVSSPVDRPKSQLPVKSYASADSC